MSMSYNALWCGNDIYTTVQRLEIDGKSETHKVGGWTTVIKEGYDTEKDDKCLWR